MNGAVKRVADATLGDVLRGLVSVWVVFARFDIGSDSAVSVTVDVVGGVVCTSL